jgi:hypothetical protein
MSTGAKIAVGCALAVVVVGVGAIALVGGAAWWVKGKAESVAAEQAQLQKLKETVNQKPFEAPADGLIREDRLVTFLEVRKRVYAVYQKNQARWESLSKKKQADFSDIRQGYNMLTEVQLAQAQAQADLGMSDAEYLFLVQQVYKSMWASGAANEAGGQTVPQVAGQAWEQAARAMEETARQAEAAQKRAGGAGSDRQAQETLEKSAQDLRRAAEESQDRLRQEIPAANIALFRKYEADIRKYAMSGLEWLGL